MSSRRASLTDESTDTDGETDGLLQRGEGGSGRGERRHTAKTSTAAAVAASPAENDHPPAASPPTSSSHQALLLSLASLVLSLPALIGA